MTDIFVLTITHGPRATPESFFFKSLKAINAQYDLFISESVGGIVEDDYGNVGWIASDVHSVRISNMERSMEVQMEQGLMTARAQAKGQRLAAADPTLKLGGMQAGQVMPFGRQ